MKADLVIRGGTIVDGSGGPAYTADVAVVGDRIASIGKHTGPAADEIDARGKIVTPGFVDVHTHLDAQLTWDPLGSPSNQHGVTSAVVGNCGVGFAPCKPADRDYLMFLMEGVEDIPRAAMKEGIEWGWESFPEYLACLAKMPLGLYDEPIALIPATVGAKRIAAMLERTDRAVIMKVGRHLDAVRRALVEARMAGDAVLIENATLQGQRVRPLSAVTEAQVPYFSLILAGRPRRRI